MIGEDLHKAIQKMAEKSFYDFFVDRLLTNSISFVNCHYRFKDMLISVCKPIQGENETKNNDEGT